MLITTPSLLQFFLGYAHITTILLPDEVTHNPASLQGSSFRKLPLMMVASTTLFCSGPMVLAIIIFNLDLSDQILYNSRLHTLISASVSKCPPPLCVCYKGHLSLSGLRAHPDDPGSSHLDIVSTFL